VSKCYFIEMCVTTTIMTTIQFDVSSRLTWWNNTVWSASE